MRKYDHDFALWGLISAGLFLGMFGIWMVTENLSRDGISRLASDSLMLALACSIVGWVFHAVAVMAGVRLTGRSLSDQAADYDDRPHNGPRNS